MPRNFDNNDLRLPWLPCLLYYARVKKLFLLLAIIIAACVAWYHLSLRPLNGSDSTAKPVTIVSGFSVSDIAGVLKRKELIRSPLAFSFYARLHGLQNALQAGEFALEPSMSVSEIMTALRQGQVTEVPLTIPEGFTVKDIDALLVQKGLIAAGAFTLCAQTCDLSAFDFLPKSNSLAKRGGRVEGYLFPDTYMVFTKRFDSKAFLERLLQTFHSRVVTDLAPDIAASRHSLHEVVTMASLIEEETRTAAERPVVSGILWKRFRENVGLGVDATVRYIVEKPSAAITVADLDVDSPYNLRKFRGLPPGPIASAGLASVRAALHPVESDYWYYLHGTDGVIRYAATNDEHNRNKAQYLR